MCVIAALFIFSNLPLSAQEIVVDWSTKSIQSAPTEIHKGDTVKVTVLNVNNILYTYTVNVSLQTQASNDDLAVIAKLLGGGTPSARTPATDCSTALDAATADLAILTTDLQKPENNLTASPTQPISLAQSLAGWEKVTTTDGRLASLDKAVADVKSKCTGDESNKFLAGPYDRFDKLRKKVEGSHSAAGQSVSSPGEVSSVQVTVAEGYTDSDGKAQVLYTYSKTLNFSSVFSLSGGVLFSTLRHPTYIRQTVPNSMNPVLGIDGGSEPAPYILGLLNYKVPRLDWQNVGFALSTGPVLRVGGGTGTSTFGYFNGLSFHFWHRLFVTAGSHVGQFADIPAGFTIGQSIPSSFGQLTPTNRWSARFAIAVTYKTNDFGSLTNQASSKSGDKTNSPPAGTGSSTATDNQPKSNTPKKKKLLGIF